MYDISWSVRGLFLTSSGWSMILVSPVSRTGAITPIFWSVPLETVAREYAYRTASKRTYLATCIPGADVMNKLQSQHSQFGVSVTTKQAVKYHLQGRSDS